MTAELLDATENLFDIARILSQNTALEHGRIRPAGSIADFPVADQSLVGVNLEQGAALGRAINVGKAHVSDFQAGRIDFHDATPR